MEIINKLGFDASQAIAELTKLDNALLNLQTALQNTGKTAGQFGTASANIGKQLQRIGDSSKTAADQVGQNVQRMTTSLALLSRVVFTQAIVRALSTLRNSFKATANDAADFQRSISLIQTIDDSKQSFGSLSNSVRKLSDDFNIPLLEASAGVYQAISNQVGSAGESLEFSGKAAEFAKATNSSLKDSVDLLSAAMKSYGLNVSETDRIASVFFKTIDLGRVEAGEFSNSFGRLGPVAKDLGISFEEVNSALAAITVRGSNTSEAITQVRAIMTALLKPSDAMKKSLADLGVSSGEAAIKSFGLFGTLDKLKQATGGSATEMAKLFPNVRGLAGASSLLGDNLKNATDNLREMQTAGRDFAHGRYLQSIANDGEKVRKEFNEIKNVFVTEVGSALLKATKQFLDTTDAAKNLTEAIKLSAPAVDNMATFIGLLVTQLAAAKLGAVGLSKALGVLALVPVAQGAGEVIGKKFTDIATARRNAGLHELEAANDAELKGFNDLQQRKIDAASAADQKILNNTRRAAELMNRSFSADAIAKLLDSDGGVTALEGLVGGKQIDTMGKLTAATESAVLKAAELREKLAAAATAGQQLEPVRNEVNEALNSVRGTGNGYQTEFADGLKTQLEALKTQLQDLAKSSNITDEQLSEVVGKYKEFGNAALNGENPGVGRLGFGQDVTQLGTALLKLRELKNLQAQAVVDPGLQASLTKLEGVLAKNPAAQFQGATNAMNNAVGPSAAIAANMERAARAAAALAGAGGGATKQAFGGMMHLAEGGFASRGIDTIPAMLSPGEFIVNARSSRKFFSQLQAINAGQTPSFRENGGSVTNVSIGDINVPAASNPTLNGREIARVLNREIRRGNARLDQ